MAQADYSVGLALPAPRHSLDLDQVVPALADGTPVQ